MHTLWCGSLHLLFEWPNVHQPILKLPFVLGSCSCMCTCCGNTCARWGLHRGIWGLHINSDIFPKYCWFCGVGISNLMPAGRHGSIKWRAWGASIIVFSASLPTWSLEIKTFRTASHVWVHSLSRDCGWKGIHCLLWALQGDAALWELWRAAPTAERPPLQPRARVSLQPNNECAASLRDELPHLK